jgi:hypothetical protein
MRRPSNEEVALLALLQLGGDVQLIDIEDIAIRADELAPGQFRWRKHVEHINLLAAYYALNDGRKSGRARGKPASGWMLTDEGVAAATALQRIAHPPDEPLISKHDRVWQMKERQRLITESAYAKFVSGTYDSINEREAMRFFRVDDYILGDRRRARIDSLIRIFSSDPELADAVKAISEKVPQ